MSNNNEGREGRLARNADSKQRAEQDRQPWSEYDDEFLQTMWGEPGDNELHTEPNLAEIAEALGRTIEACRQRYYAYRRAETIIYSHRTVTSTKGRTETQASEVTRSRPGWMDEEGLPEWYV